MISVILPTLWKINFREELIKLQTSNIISEIILINNDDKNTPQWYTEFDKYKILTITPSSNLFVNPSWNLGVNISKNEYIYIASDDVKTKTYNFLTNILNELKNDDCLIGIDKSCYTNTQETEIDYNDISNSERDLGFGCMMFLRKKSYKNIPEEYLIWRGDDFLIDLFKHKKCKVKSIKNLDLSNTKMSVSAELPEFSWKNNKEGPKEKYLQYLKEYLK